MKFYYFGGVFNDINSLETPSVLEKHNFSGVLFTYDATQGDMFVRTARDINPKEKIKYLIAIRPHTISPQYLYAIHKSINEINRGRLQLNIISGYIKDHEKDVGGIVGNINDLSSSVERSNYTIEFIKTLNELSRSKTDQLDVYVSTTNSYVFTESKKQGNKVIIPYHIYRRGFWSDVLKDTSLMIDLEKDGMEIMISMTPIIRESKEELILLTNHALKPIWKKGEVSHVVSDVEYFTPESFSEFVETLEEDGITHLMVNAIPREEKDIIIPFIKNFVESKNQEFVGNQTDKEINILGGKK